jgi:protein-tyrosine-phosphatase
MKKIMFIFVLIVQVSIAQDYNLRLAHTEKELLKEFKDNIYLHDLENNCISASFEHYDMVYWLDSNKICNICQLVPKDQSKKSIESYIENIKSHSIVLREDTYWMININGKNVYIKKRIGDSQTTYFAWLIDP